MNEDSKKTKTQLIYELKQLRKELIEINASKYKCEETSRTIENSEKNFKYLAENMPSGVLVGNSTGKHVYANAKASKLLKYSVEELINTYQKDLADPDAYPILQKRLADRIAGIPLSESYETTIRCKDGSKLYAEVFGTRVDWDGEICDLVMIRDISDKKRALDALVENEKKLKALFEFLPVGVSVLDKNFAIAYVNPALEKILSISHAGLLRGDYKMRTYLRKDGTVMPREEFASVRALKEKTAIHDVETGVVIENNSIVWTNVSAVPVSLFDWSIIITTSDITSHKNLENKLKMQATTDELTGILNRRHTLDVMSAELSEAIKNKSEFAIAILDIDYFKQINDKFGHSTGDKLLVAFTRIFQNCTRATDTFARFGGDEFILVLPQTNCVTAYSIIENIRLHFLNTNIVIDDKPINITFSCGINCLSCNTDTFDSILSQADLALYRAKKLGRNQSVVFEPGNFVV